MEGMTLEVLELIQSTAVKASGAEDKVKLLNAPELGAGTVLLIKPNGDHQVLQRTEPRNVTLGGLEAVAAYVTYAAGAFNVNPILWVDAERIRIVLDDNAEEVPGPSIRYLFRQTPEYQLLQRLAKGEAVLYEQKAFVRLLRTDLWDCLDPTRRDAWIKVFRSLRAQENSSGRSDIATGRQSLGREIDAAVSSDFGEIPDELVLDVRLFQDPALEARQKVTVDLEVTTTTFKFSLTPRASDMAEALENELSDVCKWLQGKLPTTDIFRGTCA